MKYIKYFVLPVLILTVIGSCNDGFLNTQPYDALSGEAVWGSDEMAIKGVNGIYSALSRGNYGNTFGNFALNFSRLGPTAIYHAGGTIVQGFSTPQYGMYEEFYEAMYRIIRFSNVAIEKLTDNPNVSSDLAQRLKGEAYFLRGLAYFYLWDLYGGVVILKKPLPPSKTYKARSSAEETRQLIVSDFTKAIEALPVTYSSTSNVGRATKGAAVAMLGKAYLYSEQWSKAVQQFAKLMKPPYTYELLDDYSNLFNFKYDNNAEVIFSLQYIMKEGLGNRYDMRYGGRSTNASSWTSSAASWVLVDSYTNKDGSPIDMSTIPQRNNFSNDIEYGEALIGWYQKTFENADSRLAANVIMPGATFVGNNNTVFKVYWPFAPHANDNPPAYRTNWTSVALFPWRKFVVTGNQNKLRWDAPGNIPLIRYADVLLMYAEAKLEAGGPSPQVLNAINKVRQRVGVAPIEPGLSQDSLRRLIRIERIKELAGEGHLYFDVRRWKTAATNDPVLGLNHDILDFRGEPIYHRVFEEKNYLWPIPQDAFEINDKLEQNPGW